MISYDEETIVAQATPQGSGAIAIVRLSGADAIKIVSKMSTLSSGKNLNEVNSHTIHLGHIIDKNNKHVDQVMFMITRAPKTFTGQDVVEINCHNNQFIIDQIIQASLLHGARLADPGEFSKRAVLNNKIDLLQAEAINELIHAQTQKGLKQSLSQVEGTLSAWMMEIEQSLLKALAFSEASFEFIDEEMSFEESISQIINKTISDIETIKKSYNIQQQIREGIRIALIGSVNAGKSSLFNLFLDKQRAIVTDIEGTTRDVIEAGVCKDGNNVTFVDTAGLRETKDNIEQEGIRRSLAEAEKADIILLIFDGSRELTQQEQAVYTTLLEKHNKKIILLANKSDIGIADSSFASNSIAISTKTKLNIDNIDAAIQEKISRLFDSIESPFLLNQRQFSLIMTLSEKLQEIKKMVSSTVHFELLSHHLKDALTCISELTGKSISEKGMDQVFRQFCVGK